MDEGLCGRDDERGAEMGNVLEMKEGGPGDVVDVVVKLQLAVTIYSKVTDKWGGRHEYS